METVVSFFAEQGVDFYLMLKAYGVILLCILVAGLVGRFLFGRTSRINHAVTAAISIIFIYAVAALLRTMGDSFNWLITPLPFSYISNGRLILFSLAGASTQLICEEVLCMIVLSFLVNLADVWIPRGKHPITWVFLRCVTGLLGWGGFLLVDWLSNAYLPGVILANAPTILLGLLVVLILVGALKLLVGVLLASVNPIIGGLYTFFFANIVGRQITKALVTAGLLTGLVTLLQMLGAASYALSAGAFIAYLPFIVLLLAIWYGINRKK